MLDESIDATDVGQPASLILQELADPAKDVEMAVDAVLADSMGLPSKDLQVRLAAKVSAGLARRRVSLPALLENTRVGAGVSVPEMAATLGIPDQKVRDLETGTIPLWQASERTAVDVVMVWIRSLRLEWATAMRAAERLGPRDVTPAFGGEARRTRSAEARDFVEALKAAIQEAEDGPTTANP
jgi:hypothetical protein